jgi:nucleotide-binding universal stress UspA family protein
VAYARVRGLAAEMEVAEVRLRTASSVAAGLHAAAVEEDTQLVVVGSSERSGLDRVFPGSTANRLLSGSPVAVAIAPVGYADRQPDEGPVGCGYDGSQAAREALKWAAEFARRGRRPLRVLAVQRQLAFGHIGVTGAFGAKSANDELRAGWRRISSRRSWSCRSSRWRARSSKATPYRGSQRAQRASVCSSSAHAATVRCGPSSWAVCRQASCGRLPVPCSSCPSGVEPITQDTA